MASKLKTALINTSLIIVSSIISIGALEFLLRIIEYKAAPVFSVEYRHYFKKDPEAGYDIKENFPKTTAHIENNYYYQYWSNELGCFDNPYQGEKDYVLLLGDSFTHMFAPYEDKWGTVLEKQLDKRVLKCGVVGYGTGQEYIKAKKIISMVKSPPKVIVLGYFFNDFTDDFVFPNMTVLNGFLMSTYQIADIKNGIINKKDTLTLEREIKKLTPASLRWGSGKRWLKENSAVYNKIIMLWQNIFSRPFLDHPQNNPIQDAQKAVSSPPLYLYFGFLALPEKQYPWLQHGWKIHCENLKAFKKYADSLGATLLVVVIPVREQIYSPQKLKELGVDFDAPNCRLREFFKKENIRYLDLLPLFLNYARKGPVKIIEPDKDLYWRLDAHWNVRGNQLAGLLVADYMIENNLIEVSDKDQKLKKIKEQLKALK